LVKKDQLFEFLFYLTKKNLCDQHLLCGHGAFVSQPAILHANAQAVEANSMKM
jgi:hypothetical protein